MRRVGQAAAAFGAALLAVLVPAVLVLAAPASADIGPIGPPTGPPPPPSAPSPSPPDQPTHGTVRNCSLFATSTNFGLSCVSGSGNAKTVKEILHGDPVDFCWDEPIPTAQLASVYGYPPVDGTTYYVHSCVTGLDVNNTQYNQPDVELSQSTFAITDPAADCKRPYTVQMTGQCLMHLTDNQQVIVGGLEANSGDIPATTVATHPTTRVRTNEDVAYSDAVDGVVPAAHGGVQTPAKQAGAVRMWAEMDGCRDLDGGRSAVAKYGECFSIRPYGPNKDPHIYCDGTGDVTDQDTPQSKPDACWWAYPQSSANQPDQVYPLRAEADWTVYYQVAGGAPVAFATFHKISDVQLQVFDIESIVIP
jgi:hypothetical protein